MPHLLKQTWFLVSVGLAVAAGGVGFGAALNANRAPTDNAITAERGTITEEVIVTGKTQAVKSVELAFARSGRVTAVHGGVGARVLAGGTIAALDRRALEAELVQAQANIAVEDAKLKNTELAVTDAARGLVDKVSDSYTRTDDAIRNRADQMFSNPRSASPQLNFTADPSLETPLENERMAMEGVLDAWRAWLDGLTPAGDISPSAATAKANLERAAAFLDRLSLALNALRPSAVLTQSTIDAWRSDVSTARTNINTASSNLTTAEEKYRAAPGDVAAARAALEAVKAKLGAIRVSLDETVLLAPLSGTITRQDAKVGQVVPANTAVTALISEEGYEIEANVPEVDIGKIRVGNPVAISLDAYPEDPFNGRVAKIDPAETIVDGVVNYKVTIALERGLPAARLPDLSDRQANPAIGQGQTGDARLKSGLTANLAIETEKRSDALILPQSAIIENDRGTFVRLASRPDLETPVKIGIRDQSGNVEIRSGIGAGERVLDIGRRAAP